MQFLAIDIETANAQRASICQIGIVSSRNGTISECFSSLVNPEEYFDEMNVMDVHTRKRRVGPVARARCHHALSSVRGSIDGVPRESFPGGYHPRCVRGGGERAPRRHRRYRERRRRHPEPLVPSTREPMPGPRRASHADITLDARTMRPGDLPNR